MLATNVGGIAWTVYNCFFSDYRNHEDEKNHEENDHILNNSTGLKSKITAFRVKMKSKWRNRK